MQRTENPPYIRWLVTILIALFSITLILAIVIVLLNRPPSADMLVATLAALPTQTPTLTPTPVVTLPGVNEELLVCQRTVGFELNERHLVAAANLSDNHILSLSWVSKDWPVNDLSDAVPGIVLAFDAAVEAWKDGCAVYDRVQIAVWDRRDGRPVRQLEVSAMIDDLLKWHNGEFGDQALIQRIEMIYP